MILAIANHLYPPETGPLATRGYTASDVWDAMSYNYPGVTLEELRSYRKSQHLMAPRYHLMHELWVVRGRHSSTMVGRALGDRDHTTVLYGCRKFSAYYFNTSPKATLAEMRSAYFAHVEKTSTKREQPVELEDVA